MVTVSFEHVVYINKSDQYINLDYWPHGLFKVSFLMFGRVRRPRLLRLGVSISLFLDCLGFVDDGASQLLLERVWNWSLFFLEYYILMLFSLYFFSFSRFYFTDVPHTVSLTKYCLYISYLPLQPLIVFFHLVSFWPTDVSASCFSHHALLPPCGKAVNPRPEV